ncbi:MULTISPECIES: GNAT family N-acetyltransferase [unclassified Oceanobacillus]|uniref:GNAT family N-acetyltransferase n=1 Tax=unclassified Oceanobacillus TaxID=2630292 RepID=UPI0012EB85EF|nr:GNAT family N-acetyltransferase [Oceanobacillus sp. AG]
MAEQLRLRAYEEDDINFLHKLVNDPAIMSYWFEEAYYSKSRLKEIFEKEQQDSNTRSFILTNGEQALGLVQLFDIDFIHRHAEYAIMIDPAAQGNGYAAKATNLASDYAFKVLNLHKLFLYVDEVNEKAVHVYKKCGYKYVATLEEAYFVNGIYHNAVLMNIFKRDYLGLN